MGTIISTQLDHSLTPTKGWFSMASLDITFKISTAVTFDLPPGRVVHLDVIDQKPKNTFAKTGATGYQMPLYLLRGTTDYDVANPGVTQGGRFVHIPVSPAGHVTALVATGAYELETTEFDTTQTYTANQLLTAPQADTTAATGGVITNQGTGSHGTVKQFVDNVCGVVCRGAYKNNDGANVLNLWTYFLPGAYV